MTLHNYAAFAIAHRSLIVDIPRCRSEHYGWDVGDVPKGLFVSFVPILLDTLFKLWLFTSLNKQSPSTVVTVREMDRH